MQNPTIFCNKAMSRLKQAVHLKSDNRVCINSLPGWFDDIKKKRRIYNDIITQEARFLSGSRE